jgi:hypothetical protein
LCYLRQLSVEEEERQTLREARDEIRSAIREGFGNWKALVRREEMFVAAALSTVLAYDSEPALRPKFRMQGSWSYHTLNCVTVEPPQEIDLDDGIFLPTSFLNQGGTLNPVVVSKTYFDTVERILQPLCEKRGWTLISDKSSCVRVSICQGAHIDLALYAIPDAEFTALMEKVATAAARSGMIFDRDTVLLEDSVYRDIDPDQIMLAHREKGWMRSDPRKLEDWFQDAVKRHGDQVRRVCRYLKGWRDHNWETCKLSSIALMACVVTAYDDAMTAPPTNRDDEALRLVSRRLPEMFSGAIPNPVVAGLVLNDNWTDQCRASFVAQARKLVSALDAALNSAFATAALATLRSELGPHFPDDRDLLAVDGANGAPSILTTGILKEMGQEPDTRAAVKRGGDSRYG